MFDQLKARVAALSQATASGPATSAPATSVQVPETQVADSRSSKLTVAGWELEGVSIAGQETCIIVPRAKICFDIGRCPQRAVFQQTVLISHGHLDHIGGCPFHVSSRSMLALPPSKLVVHPAYPDTLKQYLDISNQLQGSPPGNEFQIQSLKVGEEMQLSSGFFVRPFPTTHTIASQGYLLYELRKKLKPELEGKSTEEVRELRLSGQEVQETQQIPQIAFTGDTTAEFFELANEDVFRARLLIMECSFVDDRLGVEEAREKGHMHIAELVANAHRFQNEAILLIHFSSRYKRGEIISALNTWLPPALRARVVPLLNGYAD